MPLSIFLFSPLPWGEGRVRGRAQRSCFADRLTRCAALSSRSGRCCFFSFPFLEQKASEFRFFLFVRIDG